MATTPKYRQITAVHHTQTHPPWIFFPKQNAIEIGEICDSIEFKCWIYSPRMPVAEGLAWDSVLKMLGPYVQGLLTIGFPY